MTYKSINPNNGTILKTFDEISDAQLEIKLATAHACYQTWKNTSYKQRAAIMAKAAELLHAHTDGLCQAGNTGDGQAN